MYCLSFTPFNLGGGFDGSNCNRILNCLNDLETNISSNGLHDLLPVLNCLKSFKLVVDSCFSDSLSHNADFLMENLRNSYVLLMRETVTNEFRLTVTWKIHILFNHVVPFCKSVGCGLSRFAEQTGEAVHAKFKPTWSRYKRSIEHVDHGNSLLRAVTNFSHLRR